MQNGIEFTHTFVRYPLWYEVDSVGVVQAVMALVFARVTLPAHTYLAYSSESWEKYWTSIGRPLALNPPGLLSFLFCLLHLLPRLSI